MIEVNIPIGLNNVDSLINLEDILVDKVYDNFNNVIINKNFLSQNKREDITNTIYLSKDICVEYVDNISEPSVRVPNSNQFKYVVKEKGAYKFIEQNPKKIHTLTKEDTELLVGQQFKNEMGVIAQEFYTKENGYTVFSLPYCGIDKYDSYFFSVNMQGEVQILDEDVDYIAGTIEVYEANNILLVFGIFNVVPLKIIPRGSLKIEEYFSGFYTIKNLPNNNFIKINQIDTDTLLLTSLKNIVVTIPLESNLYTVDGIIIEKDQTFFIDKNESIVIKKAGESEIVNVEYLNLNTSIKNQLDTYSEKLDKVHLESNSTDYGNYLLKIINKENHNTFMKQNPITLKLF